MKQKTSILAVLVIIVGILIVYQFISRSGSDVSPDSQLASTAPSNGLVGYWKLDGNANDSVGVTASKPAGSRPGTLAGNPSWLTGTNAKINGALNFDGSDYVTFGDLDVTGDISVSMWIKASTPADEDWNSIFIKPNAYGFEFKGNTLYFRTTTGEVSAPYSGTGWQHILGIKRGVTLELYIGGVEVATTASGATLTANNNPLRAGTWNTTDEFLTGALDDIRVYNRALTTADITALYNYTGESTSLVKVGLSVQGGGTVSVTGATFTPDPSRSGTDSVYSSASVTPDTEITFTQTTPTGKVFVGWTGSMVGYEENISCTQTDPIARTCKIIVPAVPSTWSASQASSYEVALVIANFVPRDNRPIISNITSTTTNTSATISWDTEQSSDTRIAYGPISKEHANNYLNKTTLIDIPSTTPPFSGLVTDHTQTITGLTAGTTYHYRVMSRNYKPRADGSLAPWNLSFSDDLTFTTTSPVTRTLTVTKGTSLGTGTVTGVSTPAQTNIDCGSVCSRSYTSGTNVVLTATRIGNSAFAGWTLNPSVSGSSCVTNICTFNLTADTTVTATFNEDFTSDTVKPNVTGFTVPTTSSSTSVPVTITANDVSSGVGSYQITESSTPPSASTGWTTIITPTLTATINTNINTTVGTHTFYAWVKDRNNNVSNVFAGRTVDVTSNPVCSGTCKYIRPGATGTATGSDWTNAYTSIPTTLTRGTTYYLAGGGTTYPITTLNAGTGTTRAKVLKATAADHGTETGWNSNYAGVATFNAPLIISGQYITLDGGEWKGIKLNPNGNTTSCPSCGMLDLGSNGDYAVIRNMNLEGTYYGGFAHTVGINEATDPTFEYVYLNKTYYEDHFGGDPVGTLTIRNSYISMPNPPNNGDDPNDPPHRDIHNPYTSDTGFGLVFENNIVEDIYLFGWLLQDGVAEKNFVIRNNVFTTSGHAMFRLGSGNGGIGNVTMDNNIFHNVLNHEVTSSKVTERNNIFVVTGSWEDEFGSKNFEDGVSKSVLHATAGTSITNLFEKDKTARWQAGTGNIKATLAEINFVNIDNPLGADGKPGTDDDGFRFKANASGVVTSSALGAGTNLSSVFTKDIEDDTRPAIGAWDIGPYEY